LFAWACLDDCPTRSTLHAFRDAVPDLPLRAGRRAARGHGRDDYPVELLGRVVLLTIALRPTSFNACLAERHRNPALCRLLGLTDQSQISNGPNVSRFLDVLGGEPPLTNLRAVFDHLARRLGRAVPELGRHTAGDATALSARPTTDSKAVAAEMCGMQCDYLKARTRWGEGKNAVAGRRPRPHNSRTGLGALTRPRSIGSEPMP
jgi:hypothetical protein